jgi:hypothetical protein
MTAQGRMKKQRIYLDTSVIGGCHDPEFATWSLGLIEDFRMARHAAVVSTIVATEVASAPEAVRSVYWELIDLGAEVLEVNEAAIDLAEQYLKHRVLTRKYFADCLHIAVATVAAVDLLVSWNFRHVVRFDKIRVFNAVNLEHGYRSLEIYSPREVTTHEES